MKPERKAALTLLILSPLFGEVISGSTPLATLLGPPLFIYDIVLYGCGALLIRELARKRKLGWTNVWVLGLAYGVLEEGLVTTSWFNPYWPPEMFRHGYGTLLGLNWVLAVSSTLYHATFSITIPIVFSELLNPSVAQSPWTSATLLRRVTAGLVFASLAGLILFGFLAFHSRGYRPPASFLLAIALFVIFAMVGLRWRPPRQVAVPNHLSRPLVLFALSFAISLAFLVLGWGGQVLLAHLAVVTVILLVAIGLFACRAVRRASASTGFSKRHLVALMSGPIVLFALTQLPRGMPQALDALLGALVLWGLFKTSSDAGPQTAR